MDNNKSVILFTQQKIYIDATNLIAMRSKWLSYACLFLSVYIFPINNYTYGQVGIGTTNPNSSAMLHVESTTKGVLFPRMTSAQRNAITPVNGLLVFDTDSNSLFIYQALPLGWKPIKGMSSLKDLVAGNAVGDVLYWNGSDWVLTPLGNLFHFYYRDKDGDGYGDKYLTVMALTQPPGYVTNNSDCDDDNPATTVLTFYRDADGDGYGNPSVTVTGCTAPAGYVANPNDCNDSNAAINPGAIEITNGIDDNCNGLIDENAIADLPDDAFQDTNGDGIDGTESAAIFVSSNGNDANPGTKAQPKRTISAGLSAAIANAKTQVYVGDGIYAETVSLVHGISIYGGYSSANWSRNGTNQAIIQGSFSSGRIVGIETTNVSGPITVDHMWVSTANTSVAGASNYGIYLNNCSGITFHYCTVSTGSAGAGVDGAAGTAGAAALSNAVGGQNGSCDNTNGVGGAGGTNPSCGRTGGNGGAGGAPGNNSGQPGNSGVGGTPGGPGGAGCDGGVGSCTASPGQNGVNGANGGAGSNGVGGNGGTIVANYWIAAIGGSGVSGAAGNGGGGGGGGGGQGGAFINDGGGNGGGGGGAGGCGGTGGSGGTGGGGSFGIFLMNSTGLVLTNNTITSGNGGQGGAGGAPGIGGNGAPGAAGAAACTTEVGRGGNGGNGGRGGDGGYGGGGAGGVSYAVYRVGTTVTLPGSNILTAGAGGAGGTSGGNAGTAGAAGTVF